MEKKFLTRQEIHLLLPELLASAKKEKPMTLLLLKPADFRLLQTELTPSACDEILKITINTIQKNAPPSAYIGHWTGITFAILLPSCCRMDAEGLAETINRRLIQERALNLITRQRISLLFAATEAPPRSLSIGLTAEKALAKEEGRFLPLMEKSTSQDAFLKNFLQGFLQANDSYLSQQSMLSAHLVNLFANQLNLKPKEKENLSFASAISDIGMLLGSENILLLPRPISPSEFNIIKRHPRFGANLARNIGLDETIVQAVLCHHEHWDGLGYPLGLGGVEIPLFGRVLCLCNSFAALLLPRPYRRAFTTAAAKEQIIKHSGKIFDPNLSHLLCLLPLEEKQFAPFKKAYL